VAESNDGVTHRKQRRARKDALELDAAGVSDVIDESFEDRHKEKIYRILERDIKGRAPHLQFLFNAIVD
jgi:hypothetical protein